MRKLDAALATRRGDEGLVPEREQALVEWRPREYGVELARQVGGGPTCAQPAYRLPDVANRGDAAGGGWRGLDIGEEAEAIEPRGDLPEECRRCVMAALLAEEGYGREGGLLSDTDVVRARREARHEQRGGVFEEVKVEPLA